MKVEPVSRRVRSVAIIAAVVLPLLPADVTAADAPGLYVTFRTGPQRIIVTLANGTPVGATSGAPTVIAPGLYNLFMDDSAAVEGPEFDLRGPGVDFVDSMFYGENPSETFTVTFEPSSTYTWRNNEQPGVVFTFATAAGGGVSGGGAGSGGATSTTAKTGKPSTDIVGSAILPFRGALDAIVYKSGKLSLTRNGKKVTFLKTGRYTFSVDDESSAHGFSVQVLKGKPQTIASKAYVGSHDVTLALKPGRCKGWVQFQLTGPGVNIFTTLDTGCDAFLILPEQTFRPSATYTAQDLNQPSVAHASFSTLASGSPTIPKSPYGTTSGKGTLQQDIVGSAAVQATLTGALSTKGKPTLTNKGKPVTVLKSGRYKFAISDQTAKGAFVVEAVNGGTVKDLTTAPFVGKRSATLELSPGRWMYYANRNKAYYFLVTR